MKDTFKHKGLRKQLVATIVAKGITNAASQTIFQPYTVAFQSELLEVKAGDKILEIGTGSGYQTAVLFPWCY